jgi:hypothetical protein
MGRLSRRSNNTKKGRATTKHQSGTREERLVARLELLKEEKETFY